MTKGRNLGGENFSKTDPRHKDYWATPQWAVNGLSRFCADMGFTTHQQATLDVCASEVNSKCNTYIDEEMDTLITDWGTNELCWLNPPYSNVRPFLEKAVDETGNGNTTIALLKNDCSTKWFEYALKHATAVIFITSGRIGFVSALTGESVGGNNFSSMAFIFSPQQSENIKTFYVTKAKLEELGNAR